MSEEVNSVAVSSKPKMGCGTFIAVLVIVFIIGGFSLNGAVGYYYENCFEEDVVECFLSGAEESESTGVAARGTYTYKEYSADLVLNIPLEGGSVTGDISGTCEGKAVGTFDGGDNGVISGSLTGACDPFFVKIPATGVFSGTVNKENKTVRIRVTGKATGVEKTDSMILTY